MRMNIEGERVIYRLANFINLFQDKIAHYHDHNTWADMMSSENKVSSKDINATAVSLGLTIRSWEMCLSLSKNLNLNKYGKVDMSDRIELLNKIRDTTYNEYVLPLTELIGLFSD